MTTSARKEDAMARDTPKTPLPVQTFDTLYRQAWENVRYIKNERLWFTNIYALVVAATLSFLHGALGESVFGLALLGFLIVFSVLGLLMSLRLRAELEDWLVKIRALVREADVPDHATTSEVSFGLLSSMQFRWLFPIFYLVATIAFLMLLGERMAEYFSAS